MKVYHSRKRYKVIGEAVGKGQPVYVLEGKVPVAKTDCIPAGDLDIYASDTQPIPEWHPTVKPKAWGELRRFCLDIETTGLNPDTDRVIAVGLGAPGIGAYLDSDVNEAELLRRLMRVLQQQKPDVLIGYNLYRFDLPFLIARCNHHQIPHPFVVADRARRLSKAVVHGKPLEVLPVNYETDRRVCVVDLYPLVVAHDNVVAQLEGHSLKQAAIGFGLRKDRRLELPAGELHQLWMHHEATGDTQAIGRIMEYLGYDIEDTHLLADYLLPQIYYQKLLLPRHSLQELTLMGAATKWNKVLKEHYRHEPEASPPEAVQGALMVVNPGLYRQCAKIDVSSLYPSVMLKYGIWTRKDTDRYGLGVLQYLTRHRLELKRKAKAGDTEAGLMSGALKIFINSAYGLLGTPGIPFNDYQEFAKVPAYGREILQFMIHHLETHQAVIVEADTDGIIFSHPTPSAIRESLQQALPDGITIDLEWQDTAVYCAKKKSYVLFFPDGTIKANGIYKKRDRCQLEKTYPIEYLKRHLHGSLSEAEDYHRETVKALSTGNYPIGELMITRSIRANEKALLKYGKPGDKVTFYQGTGGAITDGAYSPQFYINKVEDLHQEILGAMGYGQKKLL